MSMLRRHPIWPALPLLALFVVAYLYPLGRMLFDAFTAPGLSASDLADLYLESADTANRTKITNASQPTIEGRSGRRLDTTTGSRVQTVVVWPAATPDMVNVIITNDLPDARIDDAIAAFDGR